MNLLEELRAADRVSRLLKFCYGPRIRVLWKLIHQDPLMTRWVMRMRDGSEYLRRMIKDAHTDNYWG